MPRQFGGPENHERWSHLGGGVGGRYAGLAAVRVGWANRGAGETLIRTLHTEGEQTWFTEQRAGRGFGFVTAVRNSMRSVKKNTPDSVRNAGYGRVA